MSAPEAPEKGQAVIIHESHGGYSTGTVERTTATQVILEGGGRYRLDDGRRVGSSADYHPARLAWKGTWNWPSCVDGLRTQRLRRGVALERKRLEQEPMKPEVLRAVAARLTYLATELETQREGPE